MTDQRHPDDGRFAVWGARRRAARERDRIDHEQIDRLLIEYPVDPDHYPSAKTRSSGAGGLGWASGGGDWSLFGDWGGFGGDGGGGCGGGGG